MISLNLIFRSLGRLQIRSNSRDYKPRNLQLREYFAFARCFLEENEIAARVEQRDSI